MSNAHWGIVLLYFLPAIIAQVRSKRDSTSIIVLNIFLGWTVVGWVVALAWSLMEDKNQTLIVNAPAPNGLAAAELCRHCGKYSSAGSAFCSTCGEKLNV